MSHIIVTRNPSSKRLVAITNETGSHREHVAEFETEREAVQAALEVPCCKAWGFLTLEVPPRR
jgi:hypothetical protein